MRSRKKNNKIEYIIICSIYLLIAIFVVFAKRPVESELENRKLEEFPKTFSIESFLSGEYINKIDIWFSDTVPYRDELLSASYKLKDLNGFATSIDMRNYVPIKYANEEVISTKSTASASVILKQMIEDKTLVEVSSQSELIMNEENLADIVNDYYKESGLIIYDDGDSLRAVEEFAGFRNGDESYAHTINLYKEVLPHINIYSMIIPTAIAYYAPEELKDSIPSVGRFIEIIESFLNNDIIKVDAYNTLLSHVDENIYLRTDHHWSPLGAYYAAETFAKAAGVNFKGLDSYEKISLRRYQGSLYKLSGNEKLKDSREPFVYYVPKDIAFIGTEYSYRLDANGNPIDKINYNENVNYFNVKDKEYGNGYSVYIGSDNKTMIINMPTNTTGRNLLLLKDSFGNPIPSFLFYSFDNIHIVDYRYFMDNIVLYASQNNITDILFANNIINVKSDRAASRYRLLLTQGIRNSEE